MQNNTRDALIDIHQKTDYQGDIIKEIGKDLMTANKNLEGVGYELKVQKVQIKNIKNNLGDTGPSVIRTDKKITMMQRCVFWQKCMLHTLAVLLFIAIILVVIFKSTRK
jgi:hypothetical protein